MTSLLDRDHYKNNLLDRTDELRRRMADLERQAATGDLTVTVVEIWQPAEVQLGSDTSAGATSCSLEGLPDGPAVDLGWFVFDPYTVQCEIRKWTGGTATAPTFAALTYAHDEGDPVLWVTEPVANVKWFGAEGDGTTDDSTALQAASDEAAGSVLYVPAGTYLGNFTVGADTVVRGDGRKSLLKSVILAASDGSPIIDVRGTNVHIRDLSFDGQAASQPADGFSDSFDGGSGGTGRAYRAAIRADGGSYTINELFVDDCYFTAVYGAGVAADHVARAEVRNCIIATSYFELAFCDGGDAANSELTVKDNVIIDISSGDSVTGNGIAGSAYDYMLIQGNKGCDIDRNLAKVYSNKSLIITDNLMEQTNVDSFAAIALALDCGAVIIDGNAIYGCYQGINNPQYAVDSISVTNNVIHTIAGAGTNDGIAMTGAGTNSILIANNNIYGVERFGIYVTAGKDVSISDNVIYGDGSTANGAGIRVYVSSTVNNLLIKDNSIRNFAGTAWGMISLANQTDAQLDFTKVLIEGNVVESSGDGTYWAFRVLNECVAYGIVRDNILRGAIYNPGNDRLVFHRNYVSGAITWGTDSKNLSQVPYHLTTTTTWNPANLADGASETKQVTVNGAAVGDVVSVGFPMEVSGTPETGAWQISGRVSAANTVQVSITNHTGGAKDLDSETLRVDVWNYLSWASTLRVSEAESLGLSDTPTVAVV